MKLKTMIVLGMLLFGQTLVIPINASSNALFMKTQRKRYRVRIQTHKEHERSRSTSLFISGYVEDDVLVLSFSIPLGGAQLRVVNSETGTTVFEGTASGTSLSIPLERDSENFEVYIEK